MNLIKEYLYNMANIQQGINQLLTFGAGAALLRRNRLTESIDATVQSAVQTKDLPETAVAGATKAKAGGINKMEKFKNLAEKRASENQEKRMNETLKKINEEIEEQRLEKLANEASPDHEPTEEDIKAWKEGYDRPPDEEDEDWMEEPSAPTIQDTMAVKAAQSRDSVGLSKFSQKQNTKNIINNLKKTRGDK